LNYIIRRFHGALPGAGNCPIKRATSASHETTSAASPPKASCAVRDVRREGGHSVDAFFHVLPDPVPDHLCEEIHAKLGVASIIGHDADRTGDKNAHSLDGLVDAASLVSDPINEVSDQRLDFFIF